MHMMCPIRPFILYFILNLGLTVALLIGALSPISNIAPGERRLFVFSSSFLRSFLQGVPQHALQAFTVPDNVPIPAPAADYAAIKGCVEALRAGGWGVGSAG